MSTVDVTAVGLCGVLVSAEYHVGRHHLWNEVSVTPSGERRIPVEGCLEDKGIRSGSPVKGKSHQCYVAMSTVVIKDDHHEKSIGGLG